VALAMSRPTKHPRTGVYRVRVAIPEHLREITKRLYGVSREHIQSLRTKDPKLAKERAASVVETFMARLRAAEAVASEASREPGPREIAALAGEWYRGRVGAHGDKATEDLHWDIWLELFQDGAGVADTEAIAATFPARAAAMLQAHGYAATPDAIRRLAAALARAESSFRSVLSRRMDGDWSPDGNIAKFPELPSPEGSERPGKSVTFNSLLSGWALDHGYRIDAKPVPRALYDRQRTLERFAAFLGHRDADRVMKADAVRWKEEALGRGLNAATVRNDISEMSAVWACGIRNGKLTGANPFEGTLPPKARQKARNPRAFTDDEARRVLEAAREQRGCLRWLPWVLCLTGARLNEICQSDKADISVQDGIAVIRIHDAGAGRTVKNADSRRVVPIHPALIAEGFLDYAASLPAGASLFPDVARDRVFGQRSVNAGRNVNRWLRSELGITDPNVSPNHSWRHWFIGACRRVLMPAEVRSAITGHSARLDESAGYGDGMATLVQVLAAYIAKVPCPVPTQRASGETPKAA
jgi:integrase